jgi:hypothetical protein
MLQVEGMLAGSMELKRLRFKLKPQLQMSSVMPLHLVQSLSRTSLYTLILLNSFSDLALRLCFPYRALLLSTAWQGRMLWFEHELALAKRSALLFHLHTAF